MGPPLFLSNDWPPNKNKGFLMMISGSWIMGKRGIQRLKALTESMRKVILKDYQEKRGEEFSEYTPFMCHDEKRELLSSLCHPRGREVIIEDKEALGIIEEVYAPGSVFQYGRAFVHCEPLNSQESKIFKEAIRLLCQSGPTFKERFETLVCHLIPINSKAEGTRPGGIGNSSEMAKGAVFLSCPTQKDFKALELAINLSHELGHQALMVYQSSDVILNYIRKPVYSGVRGEKRPAIQSLHALVALSYMVEFLSKLLQTDELSQEKREYALTRHQDLKKSYQKAFKEFSPKDFTEIGTAIYSDLKTFAEALNEGP